jgi:hypothetical protein
MPSKRVRLILLLIVMVGIAIPIIGAEVYLQHFGLGDPILYYANNSFQYAPLPNQRKQRIGGVWVTIDGRGLRTPKPWDDAADVRILFIGNSVTWSGTATDDKATFPYLTCEDLEKRIRLSFTCGNAGVNAYGTDNMTARLKYTDITNEQAIVVTLIYPDLLRGLTSLRSEHFLSSPPKGPLPALWEASTILLFRLVYWLRHHSLITYDHDDLAVAEESMRHLLDVLKEKEKEGKLVLVVLSPLKGELGGKESPFTKLAEKLVLEYRLPSLNMNGLLTEHYTDSTFTDEKHLGLVGHRLYGTAIADELGKHFTKHPAH